MAQFRDDLELRVRGALELMAERGLASHHLRAAQDPDCQKGPALFDVAPMAAKCPLLALWLGLGVWGPQSRSQPLPGGSDASGSTAIAPPNPPPTSGRLCHDAIHMLHRGRKAGKPVVVTCSGTSIVR